MWWKHLDTNVKPYLIKLIISILPYINTNEEVKKAEGGPLVALSIEC